MQIADPDPDLIYRHIKILVPRSQKRTPGTSTTMHFFTYSLFSWVNFAHLRRSVSAFPLRILIQTTKFMAYSCRSRSTALLEKASSHIARARTFNVYGAPELIPRYEFRLCSVAVFINVYGAPESIPRNEFRQPM
jgi:hypothetical protein